MMTADEFYNDVIGRLMAEARFETPADPNPNRTTKTITIFESDYATESELTGGLSSVIAFLSSKLEEVPEEYRATAYLDLDKGIEYDSPYVTAKIGYSRPETDEEMKTRLTKAKKQRLQAEAHQRAEYERLKAKFG